MIIKPKTNVFTLKKPYDKGIRTGTLLGFGSAYMITCILYNNNIELIMGLIIFGLGFVLHILDLKYKFEND